MCSSGSFHLALRPTTLTPTTSSNPASASASSAAPSPQQPSISRLPPEIIQLIIELTGEYKVRIFQSNLFVPPRARMGLWQVSRAWRLAGQRVLLREVLCQQEDEGKRFLECAKQAKKADGGRGFVVGELTVGGAMIEDEEGRIGRKREWLEETLREVAVVKILSLVGNGRETTLWLPQRLTSELAIAATRQCA